MASITAMLPMESSSGTGTSVLSTNGSGEGVALQRVLIGSGKNLRANAAAAQVAG